MLRLAIAICTILLLSGCITNVVHPTPTPDPPPADKLACYNDQIPDGFIRIDSLDSGLAGCPSDVIFNVYKYTPYVKRSLQSKLIVCSDAWPLAAAQATGWERWSDPYRDINGCDNKTARFLKDPNYLNVIVIKKTSDGPMQDATLGDRFLCSVDPVPDGYIRVDSLDAGLAGCSSATRFNVFKFSDYKDLAVQSKLTACSDAKQIDAAVAAGWETAAPSRDNNGCDCKTDKFINDTSYKNVVQMTRLRSGQ